MTQVVSANVTSTDRLDPFLKRRYDALKRFNTPGKRARHVLGSQEGLIPIRGLKKCADVLWKMLQQSSREFQQRLAQVWGMSQYTFQELTKRLRELMTVASGTSPSYLPMSGSPVSFEPTMVQISRVQAADLHKVASACGSVDACRNTLSNWLEIVRENVGAMCPTRAATAIFLIMIAILLAQTQWAATIPGSSPQLLESSEFALALQQMFDNRQIPPPNVVMSSVSLPLIRNARKMSRLKFAESAKVEEATEEIVETFGTEEADAALRQSICEASGQFCAQEEETTIAQSPESSSAKSSESSSAKSSESSSAKSPESSFAKSPESSSPISGIPEDVNPFTSSRRSTF